MEGDGKPLAAAGSYTINDLEDNFNPFETRSKIGNNPRGSFTISKDEPINYENDEINLTNKGEESSISHYEECIENEQPLNHNISNTNNNNILGSSFDIEEDGFDKRVLDRDEDYHHDEIKPSSSYVINRKSSRDVDDEDTTLNLHNSEEDDTTMYDNSTASNGKKRFQHLNPIENENVDQVSRHSDDDSPADEDDIKNVVKSLQECVQDYGHLNVPLSGNVVNNGSFNLDDSINNDNYQDENRLFDSSVRLPEPPLSNIIHQEAQQLVNKSFTINKSNIDESLDDDPCRNPDFDRIQQSEANNLNASYVIPNSQSTYRRPAASKGDQKKAGLNSSYSIKEGSEDKQLLMEKNKNLTKQVVELTACIQEYEKFLNLTLMNKAKSEGSSNVSMNVLLTERDQALEEAATIGRAYTDLQNRHEKSKELLKEYKKNEEKLHESIKKMDEWSERQVAKYEKLKIMAEEKITRLNEDINQQRRNHQEEMEILHTRLKYQETKIRNLETDIKQKAEQNTELTEMCEMLIKKTELEA